jgi:protein-disulfide isomerase
VLMRVVLAAILAIAATAAVQAQDRNWGNYYAVSDEGTHMVGNPDAPTKLTEFVSYSCVHCANFAKQSEAEMRIFLIDPGKVRVEVRHVIRNPVDLAAALLTECGPDTKFFDNHRLMMLRHDDWMAKAIIANKAQQQRWVTGPIPARMRAIASDLDFYELMEPRGYTRAEMDRCLGDEAKARAIAQRSHDDYVKYQIAGTPSFAINGQMQPDVHDWASLQAALGAP